MNISPLIAGMARTGGAILAPMSGITDAGFRRIASRFGATLVVSEMVASDQLVRGEAEALLRSERAGGAAHVVQLAGCEPDWMAEATRVATAAGADIIDINMGCPAKRVTNGWAGSALMRDLDGACRLIDAVIGATHVPVTLKTRLGWDHGSLNAATLAARAEALGVQLITIHGRTRQQFYKGRADWSAVRPIREAVSVPVVVNGDIDGMAGAQSALDQSGARLVMIGRAAMGQPWLVGDIAAAMSGAERIPPDPRQKADAAVEHYEGLLGAMGRAKGLRHARKHVAAYLEVAARAGSRRAALTLPSLLTSQNPDEVIAGLHGAMLETRGDSRRAA